MARKVFFSFHYQRDLWRANVVRNTGVIEGIAAVGFHDEALWDEARKQGDSVVKSLIDRALEETSVTVVLVGSETASREYITYEIERSVARGNGMLGIRINNIKDKDGHTSSPGAVPDLLIRIGTPVYEYEYGKLGTWVEAAYLKAHSSPRNS